MDIDVYNLSDDLATQLTNTYTYWQSQRAKKESIWKQTCDYLSATSTEHTNEVTSDADWSNSTTRPKLTSIADILETYYFDVLFPSSTWLDWVVSPDLAMNSDYEVMQRRAILGFMYSKLNHPESNFYQTMRELIRDYIIFGNVYAVGNNYVVEGYDIKTANGKEQGYTYLGPRPIRYSPFDVVQDPVAKDPKRAGRFVRELYNVGEIARIVEDSDSFIKSKFKKALKEREALMGLMKGSEGGGYNSRSGYKEEAFASEHFGHIQQYYSDNVVELITYYGDFYDTTKGKLYKNHVITVMDRFKIIQLSPNPSRIGSPIVRALNWRDLPISNMGMGPLENIVGLQYRLDHMENMLADALDMSVIPMTLVRGYVPDFKIGPGEMVRLPDEDANVDFIRLDPNIFAAAQMIQSIEQSMEEFAGVPRQAAGQRTPGEKTKFEVQVLESNAMRLFMHRIQWFERNLLEPLLNDMLEASVRYMEDYNFKESIIIETPQGEQVIEIDFNAINAKGHVRPRGASHFIEKANQLQNLINISNTPLWNDPKFRLNVSTQKLAAGVEKLLELDKIAPGTIKPYVGLSEDREIQKRMQLLQGPAPAQEEEV